MNSGDQPLGVARAFDFVYRIGKRWLAQWPVISALVCAALAMAGLARRVAQLHAAGIPLIRGLTLLTLPDYLVEGVAVAVAPTTAILLIVLALAAVGAFLAADLAEGRRDVGVAHEAIGETEPGRASLDVRDPRPRQRRIRQRCLLAAPTGAGCGLVCLIVPLAVWGPLLAALTPLVCLLRLNARYEVLDLSSWSTWSRVHARVSVTVLVCTFALMAGLHCYFDPPPLDLASIRTKEGTHLEGGLIAVSNGFVYLAEPGDPVRRAYIRSLPVTEIAAMRIGPGRPRRYETVPELLGAHLWRLG
jgi:hypothetical protein